MEISVLSWKGYHGVNFGLIKQIGLGPAVMYTFFAVNNPEGMTPVDLQLQDTTTPPEKIREMVGPDTDGYYKVEAKHLRRSTNMSVELQRAVLEELINKKLVNIKGTVENETFYVKVNLDLGQDLEKIGWIKYRKEGHIDELYGKR